MTCRDSPRVPDDMRLANPWSMVESGDTGPQSYVPLSPAPARPAIRRRAERLRDRVEIVGQTALGDVDGPAQIDRRGRARPAEADRDGAGSRRQPGLARGTRPL